MGNFTFNFDDFFFRGGGNLHLSLTIIFCVIHIDMDMGGAAEIFQSQEIKKKKKTTGINFTKLNILHFDYYNFSISFVH